MKSRQRLMPRSTSCSSFRRRRLDPCPYLAGQYAHYVASELQMWRRGYRKNSSDIMLVIAGKLDDHEIESLAAYYQQLRAPAPVTVSK